MYKEPKIYFHIHSDRRKSKLGNGPYRSSDIADALGEIAQSLGPRRAQIISKGMIYSPSHGDIAFTGRMFSDYLIRNLANIG